MIALSTLRIDAVTLVNEKYKPYKVCRCCGWGVGCTEMVCFLRGWFEGTMFLCLGASIFPFIFPLSVPALPQGVHQVLEVTTHNWKELERGEMGGACGSRSSSTCFCIFFANPGAETLKLNMRTAYENETAKPMVMIGVPPI